MRARFGGRSARGRNSAGSWARAWRAPGGGAMNRVKLSVRVPVGQEIMIRHIAEVRGLTRYQALARVIETGLTAIMNLHPSGSEHVADPVDEAALAALDARLGLIEALLDRSLFTASAAYTYARRAALRGDSDAERTDSAMGEAAQAAYRRQRGLAAETLS